MEASMKIAVILTAFDKMSNVINPALDNAQKKIKGMSKNFIAGGAMVATGAAIAKSMAPAVESFAKLEDAQTDLKASMMDATGAIDANFTKITRLSETLGDKLPGNTADFSNLFKAMLENGVKSQNILNGVGKAAAYLAIDLKMPSYAAGEFAARIKEATGVADEEMLKFMDTVSRLKSLGIGADEMRYAFSRSSGTLKLLGLQGLKASNDMGVLYAQMIRVGGMSGETAGTSFNNIMQSLLDSKKFSKVDAEAKKLGVTLDFFKDGKFLGVENMVAQFGKLSSFDINKRANLVQLLTGGGQDAQAVNTIISQGTAGYAKLRSEMEKKASLNDKVNLKLKTLNAIWEATTGTIDNMLAALGAGLAPLLKFVSETIGKIAGNIKEWLSNNPNMAKFLTMVISLTGATIALMGVVKMIKGIRIAMQLLNITMAANPFILVVTAAIIAISAIYAYWGPIKSFFSKLWNGITHFFAKTWQGIKSIFQNAINGIKFYLYNFTPLIIIKNWGKIKEWFKNLWEGIKAAASAAWESIKQIILAPIEWIKKKWGELKDWFGKVWGGIKDFFKGTANKINDAVQSPARMMIDKMRKDNPALQKEMQKMAQSVDDYLPHSPAKKGALSRLNKVRIVETVAESIRPNSLIDRMKKVANLTWGAINSKPGGSASIAAVPSAEAMNNTTIHFNINLNGSGSKSDASLLIEEIEKRLPQMLKKYQGQKARISFS